MKVIPATSFRPAWEEPSVKPRFEGDEIHVWRASLEWPTQYVQGLWSYLSREERKRAERFYFQEDRMYFIVARGLLRVILGRYVGKDPRQLNFCYGAHGKPSLSCDSGGDVLRFSLSHSYGLALLAITRGREVGVDLELVRHDLQYEEIAERFFSTREGAMLRMFPKHVQLVAFFNCWTRKEAYVKARGEGLTLSLNSFTVSLAPDDPVMIIETEVNPKEVSRWSLWAFTTDNEYVAGLAVEGCVCHFRFWRMPSYFLALKPGTAGLSRERAS